MPTITALGDRFRRGDGDQQCQLWQAGGIQVWPQQEGEINTHPGRRGKTSALTSAALSLVLRQDHCALWGTVLGQGLGIIIRRCCVGQQVQGATECLGCQKPL
jgi:hypothetical protein